MLHTQNTIVHLGLFHKNGPRGSSILSTRLAFNGNLIDSIVLKLTDARIEALLQEQYL